MGMIFPFPLPETYLKDELFVDGVVYHINATGVTYEKELSS